MTSNQKMNEAKKIYSDAWVFFNQCDPKYFDTANAYLSYAAIHLDEEIRNAKENDYD